MNNKLTQIRMLPPTWLRLLVIVVLVLGVFFRFVNLERKIYWYDESFTSLRVSGYKEAELIQQASTQRIMSMEDLQKYQRLNAEKGLGDTLKSLAVEDAQHPPLYYVILRYWVQWFGNSVAVRRSLSVLSSLLVFPCLYWLCLELFASPLVGWVAITLIAVSPFHVLYAQETREYSLWTVTILLSSAVLLRAMRLKTKLCWGMYAVTVALGLYTFTFSTLVIIGHGIYVAATVGFRWTKTLRDYLLASLAGLLTFVPWIWAIITSLSQIRHTTAWLNGSGRLPLMGNWLFNLCTIFFDLDFPHNFKNPFPYLIVILVVYSIYFLCRHTPKRIWLFILTLIGATALALVLPDLITRGQRSGISRYLIPCYLGIQMAVAYLLATQITSTSINIRRQKLWQLVMVTLISSGVLSCVISSQAKVWWTKYHSYDNPSVASIVNQAAYPLLISTPGNELALSYLLNPKVQFQLVDLPNIPKIPDAYSSEVFLYDPGHGLQSRYEKEGKYKLELVYQPCFWKLVKQ